MSDLYYKCNTMYFYSFNFNGKSVIMGKFFYQKVEGREKLRLGRILFLAILCVLIFWSITFIVILRTENPGIIGDSFGMMNALFSALAFALLIYTS